ncbi:MAG TPA: class II histone deacetylase [Woeseiaceae bacterium]|nr:class II histone deacetylase [Woeseiaceae bacterium]
MWHDTGSYAGVMPPVYPLQPGQHAENPDTKRRFRNLLEVTGLLDKLVAIAPRKVTDEEILRVHERAYIDRLKAMSASDRGGDAGGLTPFGHGSFEIARLSAGGVIAATDAVLDGRVRNAYALVRPPGHHALPDSGMGFCMLCNGAIAGRHALDARGLGRIAYVDWDVHHGNGTETAFWTEPRALTVSVHQDRCFPPDSGGVEARGGGAGVGCNINIPLPPGSGVGAYEATFDRVVIPALDAFEPDLIFVPSGFDAGAHDPLGRMMMHSGGYRSLTRKLMAAADRLCGGRIVMCHEGGYNAPTVPFYGLAVVEALSGLASGVEDPYLALFEMMGQQELQPHQEAVVDHCAALVADIPSA